MSPLFLEVAVLALGIFMVLYEAFASEKEKALIPWIGIGGLAAVFVASWFVFPDIPNPNTILSTFYKADAFALFFKRFALVATIIVLVMSVEYKDVLRKFIYGATPQAGVGEFFSLPVFTCAGLMWMVSAVDFVMIFVSLELVTISFYVLVSYTRRNTRSLEAGVKYLILGALSTGFLVYGITWIYGITRHTNLDRINEAVAMLPQGSDQTPLLFGVILVLIALGFKIAAAPFQFWVPDVYQGAPTPVTAFLSVGSKAAGFVVLLRVLQAFSYMPQISDKLILVTVILAAFTLIYGNLAAMPQNNLKRLLAYSSIAHAGYLLVAVASADANSPNAGVAVSFYLAGYLLMTLLSFIVMIVVANHSGGDDIAHFNGLGKRSPQLAFAMLAAMLSLAGVPFTVGFFGKFLVFEAAVQQHQYLLIGIAIVTVGAGFYYYLKVVRAIYWNEPAEGAAPITVAPLTRVTILALTVLIFLFGVFPQPVLSMLKGPEAAQQNAPLVLNNR
ncbi:MAG TPA: NADH-quinone oxidoreductase subunit N [Chthoniobacteraceae bacterium]|nr:NADH-quinone oxidoreductase subunit N [Chthoniobacteraceae bacterium]